MPDENINEAELKAFFAAAKAEKAPVPPVSLMARVLADAAEIGATFAEPAAPTAEEKASWMSRLFSPIGGLGGAFALGAFAGVGLFVGLGDTETLYSLPVMGDILTTFTDETGAYSPIDTLDYLMAES